jgi:hypothetical protein
MSKVSKKQLPLPEEEAHEYAVVLRRLIQAAGLSVSEMERRIGQGPKSLRRVFGGQVDLKLKHVVSVLRVLDMPQEKFFEVVAETRRKKRRRSPMAEIASAMESIGYGGDLVAADEGDVSISPKAFGRLVEDTVNRVVERIRREETAPPVPPTPKSQATSRRGGDEPPEG